MAMAQEPKKETKPAAQPAEEVTAAGGAEVGKPAPAFALKDTEGKEHKLADLKGKVVVLEWSNHQCPFCKRHAKNHTAETVLKKFEGKPVVWIGIDSSNFAAEKTSDIAKFRTENKIGYPILIDNSGTTGKAYGAKTTPHMFVIDQKGTVIYNGAIDDDPTGTKDNARSYVAEAIEAALAGTAVPTPKTDPYGCSVKY
jgi:peroxiredoxin